MKWNKLIFAALLAFVLIAWMWSHEAPASSDRILLLLPDGTNLSDPRVTVWLDAASEEGLHVVPVSDSDFIRPLLAQSACAGVILPDSIHQQASDIFLKNLKQFVANGGKLMLVYDAATLLPGGRYAPHESRLSELAGISYALYDDLRDKTMQWSSPHGSNNAFELLGVPPGKYYPFHSEGSRQSTPSDFDTSLRRYKYGELEYPSFVTAGTYAGKTLLHSAAGVVAGEHSYDKGSVLFVNLPLGYLKSNTDGLLLHAFLKLFAIHLLHLPCLLAVPDGVGGLILNWHVDSNAAIKPMQAIESWSLLKQGPYSVHITAGPDAMAPGDHRGFNVEGNAIGQNFIREYLGLGYTIGSHGGWIHNYFAAHVDKDNPKDLEKYLVLNKAALERVSGKPVVEYSAPDGNQPVWVTRWLEAHGFIAYYFTGDSGMGPTQGYRLGKRAGNIWAFPVLHLDRAAAFEEFSAEGYGSTEVENWLVAASDFASSQRQIRLIYFHPPGILPYRDVIEHWMEHTGVARDRKAFRWYTMTEIANFLNSRKQVQWQTHEHDGVISIDVSHPTNLAHFAWQLSAAQYAEPVITNGNGVVERGSDSWIVVAQSGSHLQFQSKELTQ